MVEEFMESTYRILRVGIMLFSCSVKLTRINFSCIYKFIKNQYHNLKRITHSSNYTWFVPSTNKLHKTDNLIQPNMLYLSSSKHSLIYSQISILMDTKYTKTS